jgi:tripartite ATP-independent transporter DctM subunit
MGMFWIATAILVLLIVLGMPIAFAIGIASLAFVLMASPPDLIMAPLRMYAGVNSFTLLALPFFILAAEIMIRAGVSTRLFAWVNMLVGRVRGGLAYVNIVESSIFGSISGAALSDIAALGKIEITSMVENGYEKDFSCALTAASSLQSPLIPPSSIAILYSGVMSLSVGSVLLGGAVPGVLMGLAQAGYVFANGRRLKLPKVARTYSTREVYVIWRDGLVALLMPLIILVGIVGGVFTPTEAAAVAVLYSLAAAVFIYRNVTMRDLYDAVTETVKTTAVLFLIVACAAIFSWVLSSERIPEQIAKFLLNVSSNKNVLLFYVNVLLIIVGMWMESAAAIILFAPILAPIMVKVGIHPIHFAVTMILNLVIGLVTPPVGVVLYATCKVGEISFERLVKAMIPFILVAFVVLAVVSYVPETVLALPRLAGLVR